MVPNNKQQSSPKQSKISEWDRTVKALKKVYIEPSTACNLACETCLRNVWSEKTGLLDFGTFKTIIDDLKDCLTVDKMAFWGIGEPTTHPRITDMIRLAKEIGLETEMISNAMDWTKEFISILVESGLDRLMISIDSVDEKQFAEIRKGADLSVVKSNVRLLNQIKHQKGITKPEIGIEFTLMKKNVSQLKKLNDLALSMEASSIIVSNLLPYSEEDKDEILYWSSATDVFERPRSKWNPEISLPRVDINPGIINDIGKISFEALNYGDNPTVNRNYKGVCPFVERGSVAVTSNGDVSPCVPLMHSYSCYVLGRKKHIQKHYFGSIEKNLLTQIWNNKEYEAFRHKVLNKDFSPCIECGGCDLNEANQEDCFGNVHPTCGDCLWATGVIQCP